ncbi:polysaccharide deacetylase family protein [Mycolicibacterium gilvum]|uniref:Polysaccharide deacetylase n=1 Tax=Mycolicibacterium gilvum TaxID=1804 RepID=A0A378SUU4_9MYCO|nr:polysaccharide deacetylase family protein [Mycolicibacterium gilvum]MCV7058468.1 polysaccharide deacetylase family protein [Mycolicibacterium gilvum]STZ45147.1 polysaccharide deacetylase [Mycolicibacterium gilvum]
MTSESGALDDAHRRQARPIRRLGAVVLGVMAVFTAAPTAAAGPVDCAAVPCVALTFDDGPGPHTDRLLDVLRAHGAKATFFVIGEKVAADPAATRRITDAGMQVGNHTWQHLDMTTLAPPDVAAQFARATEAIDSATGQRTPLARTGFGAIDDSVLAEAGRQGLTAVNWDVNPRDWHHDADPDGIRDAVLTQVRPGAVVLLHDTVAATVDAMADVVPALRARGYHLVTVSQLLGPLTPGSLYGSRERA